MRTLANTIAWSLLAAVALLWPSRVLAPLDGLPLNGTGEALLIGLALPALWWLAPQAIRTRPIRLLIVALVAVKALGGLVSAEGLCARVAAATPLSGSIQTIPIDEPSGVLRSWDVRADWRAPQPTCTAVFDRPYLLASQFPAWFVNIVDFLAPRRDLRLDVTGFVDVPADGTLIWRIGEDMTLVGRIGPSEVGGDTPVALPAGVHALQLHATLSGERWSLEPLWNGQDAWRHLTFTRVQPGSVPVLASALRWSTTLIVVALLVLWAGLAAQPFRADPWLLGWAVAASLVMALCARSEALARVAPLALAASVAVPVSATRRHWRTALLLIGVPWLVLFGARAWPQIGQFSSYSADDWLTYQVAGYRIFMHGYWLEGGTAAFDYQPLYRWSSGVLHLVFGDSSVGELFWDAACLLTGALVAFRFVNERAGFSWALAAASLTLTTFTAGTPWYFLGRGLSEIAAAGFGFGAVLVLSRATTHQLVRGVSAGVLALLMFFTRLNHLLFAVFIPAALFGSDIPARWSSLGRAMKALPLRPVTWFGAVFTAGLLGFVTRTWWYTGVFSLFYGTSLRHNDTGLRPWTLLDGEVWGRVVHSLAGLMFMNEPPSPDIRAALVTLGVLIAVAALFSMPVARQQPLVLVILVLGACVGALFAHAHHYPGRLSIHLVPFATALSMTTVASLVNGR